MGDEELENDLVKYIVTQGPFCALFLWLLWHVMRTNEKRENEQRESNEERERELMKNNKERESRLQDLLDKFSDKYDLIITEIRDIKGRIK